MGFIFLITLTNIMHTNATHAAQTAYHAYPPTSASNAFPATYTNTSVSLPVLLYITAHQTSSAKNAHRHAISA